MAITRGLALPTPVIMYTQQKPQFAPDSGSKLCIHIHRSRYVITPADETGSEETSATGEAGASVYRNDDYSIENDDSSMILPLKIMICGSY